MYNTALHRGADMLHIQLRMTKNRQINVRMTEEDERNLHELERLTGATKSEILRKYLRMGILRELENARAFLAPEQKRTSKKRSRS